MFKSKDEVRRYVWRRIERFCRFPPYGRIPYFYGAERACERVTELEEFTTCGTVFSAPDGVLLRLREIVLEYGKTLVAALPKMKDFVVIRGKIRPTIANMQRYGEKVELSELGICIFAQGCVAVDLYGNRIGKGSGFGDREYEILKSRGAIDSATYIVVAHELQVFDDLSHLVEEHDVRADVILTPDRVIRIRN